MQAKKGVYNITFGLLSQIITIILGITIPRLFLVNFGSEMNGLLASINQMIVYLALLEAGVGTATITALYGPISRNDKKSISEILSATNKYYKKTGVYYLLMVIIFAFAYPFFVNTSIDRKTVIIVILLNGLVGVLNFFFQGKFFLLLQAEGKNYILTNLGIIVQILTSLSKILLLNMGYNIIVIQSVYLLFNLIQIFFVYHYINKNYKWLNLKLKPDFKAISQKNAVLVHQFSGLIFNNTDIIILTLFCDLKLVSVYTMYALLFRMVSTVLTNISVGLNYVLGQTFNSNRKRYIKMHDSFEVYYLTIAFALFTIANIFILPFMKLYTNGISDINYLDKYLPILFTTTFLLSICRNTPGKAIDFANHYKKTQLKSIIESSINLIASLILVNYFGIYGVLMGTIIALFYRTNDVIFYASRNILKRSPWITYRRSLINFGIFFIILLISNQISIDLSSYYYIFGWAALYCIIIIPLFLIVNSIVEKDIFKYTLAFVISRIRILLLSKGLVKELH
jgi:O-antigen/teichoic acid export membrane protein